MKDKKMWMITILLKLFKKPINWLLSNPIQKFFKFQRDLYITSLQKSFKFFITKPIGLSLFFAHKEKK